jgi:hypothetical protein
MRRPLIALLIAAVAPLTLAADAPKPATTAPTTQSAATTKPQMSPEAKVRASINSITKKQIDEITYEDVEEDTGIILPIANTLDDLDNDTKKRLDDFMAKVQDWPGAKDENVPQRVRNLMTVCALSDMIHGEFEREAPYMIFDMLKAEVEKDELIKVCAWMTLKPDEGRQITRIPDLGWDDEVDEASVRERASGYAKKLLGRLLGKLPKKEN